MYKSFMRVGVATPKIAIGNCQKNCQAIYELVEKADVEGVKLLVFPELCVTGYTCGDLFRSMTLLNQANVAVAKLVEDCKDFDVTCIVGAPVLVNKKLFNCAVVFHKGSIFAVIPNNHNSEYEKRYFSDYNGETVFINMNSNRRVQFGTDFIIPLTYCIKDTHKYMGSCDISVVFGEYFTNNSFESSNVKESDIICNLAAVNELVCSSSRRRNGLANFSVNTHCSYLYANAGIGESTTDGVFSGHSLILEDGEVLKENRLFELDSSFVFTDIDTEVSRLSHFRDTNTSFSDVNNAYLQKSVMKCDPNLNSVRKYRSNPFIPMDRNELSERCNTILDIQSYALMGRLNHTHSKKIVLGLSGGLDSTLALLVMVRTMNIMKRPRTDIVAVSMPCFGTTKRTKNNAEGLAKALGVTFKEINITKSVLQHFEDIGQDKDNYDVTYENSQARERTQVLMDIANLLSGFVVGTGDLSELAQGWCTFNGDHMSMYAVNADVPKTLMREIVKIEAHNYNHLGCGDLAHILLDICSTPVSPELLPTDGDKLVQTTEKSIGPYELHDFFLYYHIKFGFTPKKIYYLAQNAFAGKFNNEEIRYWLGCFFIRFFNQQFKRSCMPDGPKIGSIGLSPRGDLCMPSDADVSIWMEEIKDLEI